jgi:predicted 3-demethylubiquinone-9 3-methyltransferase (glyoxalase superfamily)
MQKISPFLWFDTQAEEAANFYVSVFPNSRILNVSRYEGGHVPEREGQAMVVDFELFGEHFMALNGGPEYKFSEATSFMVHCETQEEVDRYWSVLTEGGKEIACGWLSDKYGLCWQITPTILREMLMDEDRAKASRVFAAMMEMVKIDIPTLEAAAAGP